jgi:hypothetical protein
MGNVVLFLMASAGCLALYMGSHMEMPRWVRAIVFVCAFGIFLDVVLSFFHVIS